MAKQGGGNDLDKEMGGVSDDDLSTISQIESSGKKGKGGKKKLLFIIIPVLLVLGGGGFAAYHFLLAGKNKKKSPEAAVIKPQTSPGPMIKLKSFLTNLADENKTAYVKVSMSIELKQGGNVGLFKQSIPKIRNSIIMILSAKTSKEINTPQGIVSLRHQIARNLNQILGNGTVVGVYFNNYLVQ